MISDVLFEAREDILKYLQQLDCYQDENTRRRIAEVILAMDRLRWSEGFDLAPGAPPLDLPQDATEYLNLLLASKNAPTQKARHAAEAASLGISVAELERRKQL
jgi:hypothetical protein